MATCLSFDHCNTCVYLTPMPRSFHFREMVAREKVVNDARLQEHALSVRFSSTNQDGMGDFQLQAPHKGQ